MFPFLTYSLNRATHDLLQKFGKEDVGLVHNFNGGRSTSIIVVTKQGTITLLM